MRYITIPKSQELKTIKVCFMFLLHVHSMLVRALSCIVFFPQSRTQADGAVTTWNMVSL